MRRHAFALLFALGLAMATGALADETERAGWIEAAFAARAAGDYDKAVTLLRRALVGAQDSRTRLLLAETLAWQKRFNESEHEYREVLITSPSSHDALLGLARVLMWKGSLQEARVVFDDLLLQAPADIEALEGSATTAYWSGDFRTAARRFQAVLTLQPERALSRDSLRDIRLASRAWSRASVEATSDDQPYRWLRSDVRHSWFSDPLTRIDVAAGSYLLSAPDRRARAHAELASIGAEVPFPLARLSATAVAGLVRAPDGTTRPIGEASLRYRPRAHWEVLASIARHELLSTASSIQTHTSAVTSGVSLKIDVPKRMLAAVETGSVRYSDGNNGVAADGYLLYAIAEKGACRIWVGTSAGYRDTDVSTFGVEAISSTRSPSNDGFIYTYHGAYDSYWTPRNLREGRLIAAVEVSLPRKAQLRVQAEGGLARDSAAGFGPLSGPTPLPTFSFRFETDRTYHPVRAGLVFGMPLTESLTAETRYDLNVTAFYRAKSFSVALVRRR
ncbi:MAG: tetratricopeptide repeat protein [Acidobacteriota bacterium]